jgi:hypothetical protein
VSLRARVLAWLSDRYRGEEPRNSDAAEDLPRTYTIRDYKDDTEYLTRTVFPRVFGVRPLLHRFHRPDADRHEHNHPWIWCFSVVLCGSYDEVRGGRERRVRFFNLLRHGDYHRIARLNGEVWTLFLAGRRVSSWGFKTERGHVDHQTYKEQS